MSVIKRYDIDGRVVENPLEGDYVLHADHLASHAFDEEVERVLCNVSMIEQNEQLKINGFMPLTLRQEYAFTAGWIRCAKSRAKRAGGAE